MSSNQEQTSDINLSLLSVAELSNMSSQIEGLLEQKQREKIIAAYENMHNTAIELGFDNLESLHAKYIELKSESKKTKNRAPVEPVFRNPNNEKETWTGRGKAPRWLVAIASERDVKVSQILEEFRI